jgi:hypothetical protein
MRLCFDNLLIIPTTPMKKVASCVKIKRGALLALGTCVNALLPVSQAMASDEALKNVTVFGSLATYAFAWLNRSTFECKQSFRFSLHSGADNELSSLGISASLKACDSGLRFEPIPGTQFRILPTAAASNWKSSSGANQNGLFEATFTPRAQFMVPLQGMKLDATFGIGVSYLTETSIGSREKSTAFQFSDELSLGVSDNTETFRLAWQYRHISNLGIKNPNNPVDFRGVTLTIQMR